MQSIQQDANRMSDKKKKTSQLDSRNMQRKASSNRHQSRDKNQGASGSSGLNVTQQNFKSNRGTEESVSQVENSSTRYKNKVKRDKAGNMVISSNFEA